MPSLYDKTPLIFPLVAIVLGIVVGEQFHDGVGEEVGIIALSVSFVFALVSWKWSVIQGLFIFVVSFTLGAVLSVRAMSALNVLLPEEAETYEAVVTSIPEIRGKVVRFDAVIVGNDSGHKVKLAVLRDTVEGRSDGIRIGDGLLFRAKLEYPHNYITSAFDYSRWMKFHGYVATAFVYYKDWQKKEGLTSKLTLQEKTSLWFAKCREQLLSRLKRSLLSEQSLAVVSAMSLGDKRFLDADTKNVFAEVGASHVLALSGLHLGILTAFLSLLLLRGNNWQFLRRLMTIALVWLYVFLVGMPPSIVRAALLMTIFLALDIRKRKVSLTVNILCFVALVMLILSPLMVFDVGFQLSFVSVASIVVISGYFFSKVSVRKLKEIPMAYYVVSMSVVSISAQLSTAPLIAYYFGKVSFVGVFTNIIVVLLSTVLLYLVACYFLSLLLSYVSVWVAESIGTVIETAINFIVDDTMLPIMNMFARLPFSYIDGMNVTALQTVLLYVLIVSVGGIVYILLERKG